MKVGKFRAIALSILCCLLLLPLSACALWGDDNTNTTTQQPEEKKKLTVEQAQTELTQARAELETAKQQAKGIEKAEADVTAARKAAETAKVKADTMRTQTEDSGKNPNDINEAPNTYNAIKAWERADRDVITAEDNLKKLQGGVDSAKLRIKEAEQSLQEAQQREQGTATPVQPTTAGAPATGGNPVLPFWVPLLLSALLLLSIAQAFLSFLLFRSVLDNLKAIESSLASTEKRLEALDTKQAGLPGTSNAQTNNTQQLSVELSRLQTTVSKMESVLTGIAYTVQNIRQSPQGAPPPPNYASEESAATPAAGRNVIEFPITAEDYHSRVASDLVPVSHDFLRKMLVKAADGEGVMLLVDDGSAPGNMNYVVPQHKRFQSKSDFMHYSDYFDCPNPSAGEITIIRPAIVSRASGGWQLHDRGVLRV
jgi:predicted  nucleic acid-binding Zn-ribbon protein